MAALEGHPQAIAALEAHVAGRLTRLLADAPTDDPAHMDVANADANQEWRARGGRGRAIMAAARARALARPSRHLLRARRRSE